jgi:hypothetical protein
MLRKVVARMKHYCVKCGYAIYDGDICVQSEKKPYNRFFHPYCTPYCHKASSRICKTVKKLEQEN